MDSGIGTRDGAASWQILSMTHGVTILRYKFNKCDHKKPIQNTLRAYINPHSQWGQGQEREEQGKGVRVRAKGLQLRHITNASRAAESWPPMINVRQCQAAALAPQPEPYPVAVAGFPECEDRVTRKKTIRINLWG